MPFGWVSEASDLRSHFKKQYTKKNIVKTNFISYNFEAQYGTKNTDHGGLGGVEEYEAKGRQSCQPNPKT